MSLLASNKLECTDKATVTYRKSSNYSAEKNSNLHVALILEPKKLR